MNRISHSLCAALLAAATLLPTASRAQLPARPTAGVPCADLGADWASCATGRLILQNRGHSPLTDGGWKLYLHSIRRLLRIDRPGFTLRHLTGDLYELTPQPGTVRLAQGERIELPFVAEYWLRRYSDVIPRPYVVVDGAAPACCATTIPTTSCATSKRCPPTRRTTRPAMRRPPPRSRWRTARCRA